MTSLRRAFAPSCSVQKLERKVVPWPEQNRFSNLLRVIVPGSVETQFLFSVASSIWLLGQVRYDQTDRPVIQQYEKLRDNIKRFGLSYSALQSFRCGRPESGSAATE